MLAGLGNRVFLMNNVHEDAPVVFETRWAMSYLRGPLTRGQIKTLMARRGGRPAGRCDPGRPRLSGGAPAAPVPRPRHPSLPGDRCCRRTCRNTSSPSELATPAGAALVYAPMLFGAAEIRFADARKGLDTSQAVAVMTPLTAEPVAADWDGALEVSLAAGDLEASPEAAATFAELPPVASKPKSYDAWRRTSPRGSSARRSSTS